MSRRDGLILAAILVSAAVRRFVWLPSRGQWGDDQGNEMLAMLLWVRDGQVPLLGPVSSLGTAHHRVGFYWILAPSAFLTDANPVAALATLAALGVIGVAATWWLGRTVAGPLAGHVAGLLMAVSPSAISASTFVWNSNIVAPFAALAFHGRLACLANRAGPLVAGLCGRNAFHAARPLARGDCPYRRWVRCSSQTLSGARAESG